MPLTGKGHRKKVKREQKLAVAAAATAQQEEEEEEEADVQQQQAADDADGGSAAESEEPQPAVDSAALMREITATGRHFSKIAQQYRFDATAQGYVNWTVQFKAEMQFYDLADVLERDPLAAEFAATAAADATLVRSRKQCIT